MTKLKMRTQNKADENYKKLSELFPNAVTETIDETTGEVIRAIDKDVLMQEINTHVVDGKEERYQFTWPDKKKSVLLANSPIAETLRPCREESVDFDNTENLYIEGDNLDVLKLLQETYLGKVKMIYIDPPYNTGNDFVYNDDFAENTDDYLDHSGQFDKDGNQLFQNTESNGRFHTDWLNMIYPRVKLAKNLLSNDGVLIISISDAEFHNLKEITDEIFGSKNYCGDIIWNSTKSVTNTALISVSHTYNLIYFKNMDYFVKNRSEFRLKDDGDGFENPDNDPRGPWKADPFQVGGWRPNQQYEITNPKTGTVYKPNAGCSWKNDYKNYLELLKDNRIVFGKTGDSGPQRKRFIWEAQERGKVAKTLWDDVETTTNGTQMLKRLFNGANLFDNPKPVGFLKRIVELAANTDSIILDFFSGSATTAHAVMQLNAEDGGHRKFIMVQLPEKTDEKSEAFKAGYKNICEIGKERIRRAGKKIKEDLKNNGKDMRHLAKEVPKAEQLKIDGFSEPIIPARWGNADETAENEQMANDLDIGFRVLKLDSTNMKDVYYNPAEITIDTIMGTVDNIKEDRTPEDLLFQVMLDLGVLLSSKVEQSTIGGKTVFNVEDSYLIACFDDNVTDEVITAIAKQKPYYFVMRDSSMANDSVATNFEQIFAAYSPDTVRKVL